MFVDEVSGHDRSYFGKSGGHTNACTLGRVVVIQMLVLWEEWWSYECSYFGKRGGLYLSPTLSLHIDTLCSTSRGSFQCIGAIHILMCDVMQMKLMQIFGVRPSKCLLVASTCSYVEQ